MNLLEEIQADFEDNEVPYFVDEETECLHDEIISEHHWYHRRYQVFRRGTELVGIEFNEGTDLDGEAFYVKLVTKTVFVYERA